MRTTHLAAHRRRLALVIPAGLTLIAMAALAGCSSGSSASSGFASDTSHAADGSGFGAPAVPSAAASASAPAAGVPAGSDSAAGSGGGSGGGSAQSTSANRLAPSGQQLIYTAQLTVRARDVGAAVIRATSIATSAGGYVSGENASSGDGHPDKATATITLKIPVAVYAATLAQLSTGLGIQLSLQQQAQDVTQQVADVASRVASDEAAIIQLRALLKHAGSVGDLLTVQEQINSEEGDLEAMQSQQSALNHQTSFATVTITVVGPKAVAKPAKRKPAATPGFTSGIAGGWHAFRTCVSWFLAILGAVAPFVAVVALLGALAYWIRRRLVQRGQRPAGS